MTWAFRKQKAPPSPKAGRSDHACLLVGLLRTLGLAWPLAFTSPSPVPFKPELPARRRRRAVVPPCAKLDLAVDNAEVEIVHEMTVAAHFTEFPLLRSD